MKWSWRIGRIAGVDIYIHATFLILLLYIGISQYLDQASLIATLFGILFLSAVFGCVLLHELGHALAAQRFGIMTRDITLLPIGGVARLERMPDKPLQELCVAIAGPLVNVVIAAALWIGLTLNGSFFQFDAWSITTGSFLQQLLKVNLLLVVFNLIPAFPMDGGRVLRAILALKLDYTVATQIAGTIGQAIALIFVIVGVFIPNPFLIFIALFVWIGAAQETSMTQMRTALSGIPVGRAMLTDFRTLSPDDRLSTALELMLVGSQSDFPVVDGDQVVGILSRSDLQSALSQYGQERLVADAMQRNCLTVDPGEMLEIALSRMQDNPCRALPVVRDGQLVGLLTADNVGEFLMIQAALAKRTRQIV